MKGESRFAMDGITNAWFGLRNWTFNGSHSPKILLSPVMATLSSFAVVILTCNVIRMVALI